MLPLLASPLRQQLKIGLDMAEALRPAIKKKQQTGKTLGYFQVLKKKQILEFYVKKGR